jgi:hypothetical protein
LLIRETFSSHRRELAAGWEGNVFMTRDWEVMAVDVTTNPTIQVGTPRLLFKLQGPLPGNPSQWKNVSSDGERFIFAMPTR